MSYANRQALGIVRRTLSSKVVKFGSWLMTLSTLNSRAGPMAIARVNPQPFQDGLDELAGLADAFFPCSLLEFLNHRLMVIEQGCDVRRVKGWFQQGVHN